MKKQRSFLTLIKDNKSYILVILMIAVFTPLVLTGVIGRRTPYINPNVLVQISYTMVAVVSLNLVVGFLGELSLGHAGFVYVGSFVAGVVMFYGRALFPEGTSPALVSILCFVAALILGGLAAMLYGFIVGLPALRLRGDYLAIVTLASGEIIKGILKNIPLSKELGSNTKAGFSVIRYADAYDEYLVPICLTLVLITVFCVQNITRSKHGRAVTAIKDNEIAARAMGVNITYYKLIIFAIAAMFAGIAGAMFANYTTISPSSGGYNRSIEFLVIVVLGGMGSIFGSLVSAIVMVLLDNTLSSLLSGNLAALKTIIYALVLILMMLFSSAPAFIRFREKVFSIFKSKKKVEAKANNEDAASAEKGDAE